MPVQAYDIDADGNRVEEQEEEPKQPPRRRNLAAGVLALAFGVIFWAVGGKYTLEGWVIGLNLLLGFLDVPVRIARPDGWWVLLFVPLAAAYSWVEVRARPPRLKRLKQLRRWLAPALLWAIVIGTDVGSTFAGVQNPGPRPWPISVWLAATDVAGGVWAVALTFFPESLILYGWRELFG